MISRALEQQMCFTKYLIQRDCLTASFTRLGNGFSPPSVLSDARHHLINIQTLLDKMEHVSKTPLLPLPDKKKPDGSRDGVQRGDLLS